ncbi:MAG: 4-(cytidine 5'-diphospho)-2-C-methyl-D-erythritol kinase [Bacteroidetes bacterium]|nr:4-(cytidine 5'-diphospho)-2-C-methyl-D-erythritol kinase [Bacteroidota bacterium]
MITFPPAKINLGLRVLNKRTDGYHNIESIFYPVELKDILEIIPSPDGEFSFTSTGLPIPGKGEDNLVVRAFRLMQQRFGLPRVHMHLHKMIPMGSGLGGGSSDAAFAIVMLNRIFATRLTRDEQLELAAGIGSDCPFFIVPTPCLARGRGEVLTPLKVDLKGYHLVLVCPDLQVSTKQAFALVTPMERSDNLLDIISTPIQDWKDKLGNDFEVSVFSNHPSLRKIKDLLYRSGALYSSMSGSGSAVYGIFREDPGNFLAPEPESDLQYTSYVFSL